MTFLARSDSGWKLQGGQEGDAGFRFPLVNSRFYWGSGEIQTQHCWKHSISRASIHGLGASEHSHPILKACNNCIPSRLTKYLHHFLPFLRYTHIGYFLPHIDKSLHHSLRKKKKEQENKTKSHASLTGTSQSYDLGVKLNQTPCSKKRWAASFRIPYIFLMQLDALISPQLISRVG